MIFARLITATVLSSFLITLTSCSEDPIQADLSKNDLSLLVGFGVKLSDFLTHLTNEYQEKRIEPDFLQ